MIHYMRTCFATMMRTGKPAQRRGAKPCGRQQRPRRPLPGARAAAPTTISTSRPAAPIPSTMSRLMKLIGREDLIEDPRFATGDARVQHAEELDRDHRRMDRAARQARGDGEADRGRRAGGRGVRYAGTAERARVSKRAASCSRSTTTTATTRWRAGRCGSTASASAERRAGARRRHRRGAGELARDRFRRVRQPEDRRRTLSLRPAGGAIAGMPWPDPWSGHGCFISPGGPARAAQRARPATQKSP